MTSMKSWEKELSDQDIWKIVAYQKKFAMKRQFYDAQSDSWLNPPVEETF